MAVGSFLPPLRRSMMGGFLTGIVAVLVFISGIALTAAGSIGALVDTWNASVTGTLTVQIAGQPTASAAKATAVIEALRKLPEVKRADVIAQSHIQALLKPWLNDEKLIADLPLPALIDVELSAPSADAVSKATAAIKAIVGDAVIDDHRVWLNRIADFALGLSYVALALMAMALGALILTVIFATRASLTEYVHVIEVLHLVGAHDAHIASQFSWRAMRQTLWGGALGLMAFAPALGALAWLAGRIDAGILPPLTLPPPYWIGLCLLPPIAGIIAYVAAMATVRRALSNMI
jgi:cell division transport system permease protein